MTSKVFGGFLASFFLLTALVAGSIGYVGHADVAPAPRVVADHGPTPTSPPAAPANTIWG